MVKVLNPIRKKLALKKSDSDNKTPKIISVHNELDCLNALKKELDERTANYGSTIVVKFTY